MTGPCNPNQDLGLAEAKVFGISKFQLEHFKSIVQSGFLWHITCSFLRRIFLFRRVEGAE